MKHLRQLKQLKYKLQLERLVVGVEEPIFIKGIGNILSKVDSGNGAYNVIHGENFYYQGNTVVFTTFDEDENEKKVSKKIQDTIIINTGAGNTEERPVVLFDVKFANEEYQNVPFTVGNRASNKNKVLLGKEFLTKELDALIDVSADNIADKNINVDVPIKETASNANTGNNNFVNVTQAGNPSGSTSTLGKIGKAAAGTISGAKNMFYTIGTKQGGVTNMMKKLTQDFEQAKQIITNIQQSDKKLIFKYLNQYYMQRGILVSPFISNPQIIKILDYIGQDFVGNINTDNPVVQQANEAVVLQNTQNSFNPQIKTLAKETRPILYLVIFRGDQLENASSYLSSNYTILNNDIYKMMVNIADNFGKSTTIQLMYQILPELTEQNIMAAFILVAGINKDRVPKLLIDNSRVIIAKQQADERQNNVDTNPETNPEANPEHQLDPARYVYEKEPVSNMKNVRGRVLDPEIVDNVPKQLKHVSDKNRRLKLPAPTISKRNRLPEPKKEGKPIELGDPSVYHNTPAESKNIKRLVRKARKDKETSNKRKRKVTKKGQK